MSKQVKKMFATAFALGLCSFASVAQDLENIAKERPVGLSGGISAGLITYSSSREYQQRDPAVWTISGAPTLSIYGVQLPFSFTFSQRQREFRQPFNQFGVTPTYKWLKFHAGYSSVNFSNYTLAGHTFLGGGVEANPGILRFGFIYGRFLKAVDEDTASENYITPAFERKGFGAKLGLGTSNNFFDIILFKARDDVRSIRIQDSLNNTPAENLVVGINTSQSLFKFFTLYADVGVSAYTQNILQKELDKKDIGAFNFVYDLYQPRISSQLRSAGDVGLTMRFKPFSLNLKYRRIEQDYQTMGAYYFSNDLEQYTVSPSWSMFKRKVRVNGSVGIQRNNLSGNKENTSFRQINSFNINFNPNAQWNFNTSYTNFQINQQRKRKGLLTDFDTLELRQFSHSGNLGANYNVGNKDYRHTFSCNLNVQLYQDENRISEASNDSRSLSPNFSYRYNDNISKYGINLVLNYNDFMAEKITTSRWGATLGGNKRMIDDKLSMNISGTYYSSERNKQKDTNTLSFNYGLNYQLNKHHGFNAGMNYIVSESKVANRSFNEFLGNFAYTLSF